MNPRDVLRRALPAPLSRALWSASKSVETAQQLVFERRLGVRTRGHVYLDDVGDQGGARFFYEGCQWLPVRRALRLVGIGPESVFVDLGSGKGQAVLIAATQPYKRVIGVELLEDLTAQAKRNLAAASGAVRARDVELMTDDVLKWEVPDDLSVAFMYSPFIGEVFHEALERVFQSYDRRPRDLHIVYTFPWEHNWLIRSGRVVPVDVLPAHWPAKPWWWRSEWAIPIYRVVAAGEGRPAIPQVRRRLFRPKRALERWGDVNDQVFRLSRDGKIVAQSEPEPSVAERAGADSTG